jgi:Family of unknown function (DUF6519)
MAGDYTRFTYRPEDAHSAVLMQQGRVELDADWNELVELIQRRLRVETVDVIGRCGVPRETLEGFKIGGTVSSGLTIGVGRCYVDGLLAENRGTGTEQHEPVWGERVRQNPTPYLDQPYLKPAPNPPGGTGPHLVYLDVWERELTAAEDPDLVEPAVGVDTANRLQTVWAVRIEANIGAGVTCDSDWSTVSQWADITRPSGARLTSAAQGTVAPPDPCHVSPAGGYRGVDNRLYRVEVHDDGSRTGRPPSFKWSRDNGAVAAELRSMSDETQSTVTVGVRRIGRDGTLRFKEGDWVELTDDVREFAGLPGVMGKIAPNGVDAQANEITLIGPLETKVDSTKNARVRRWDQQAQVDPNTGAIPIGATPTTTPFKLEYGIEVSFDLEAPGDWHVGDYWVFAARAGAEAGTIEELQAEPPRGTRHHYCRLALLESGAPTDCRVLYPPEPPAARACCDCDICVTPASHADGTLTIQDAIDKIKNTGGKVCLAVGNYVIKETIRIWNARSLTFAGKGVRTVIDHRGKGPAIDILTSAEVTVDHIGIAGARAKAAKAGEVDIGVSVRNSIGVTVQRCFISEAGALTGAKNKLGATVTKAPTKGAGGIGIGLAGFVAEIAIRENVVIADIGVAALPALGPIDASDGALSVGAKDAAAWKQLAKAMKATIENLQRYLVTHGLWIEDNLFACERVGVDLGRAGRLASGVDATSGLLLYLGETRIAGNAIYLCAEAGIVATGLVPSDRAVLIRQLGSALDDLALGALKVNLPAHFQISLPNLGGAVLAAAANAARLEIVRNQLGVAGWGIVFACDQTRVAGNDVCGFPLAAKRAGSGGILLLRGLRGSDLDGVEIVDNRVREVAGHAISVLAPVNSARIEGNTVERAYGCGIFVADGSRGSRVIVSRNQLFDVANAARAGVAGVALLVAGADRADIEGNVIVGAGGYDVAAPTRVGIFSWVVRELRVSANEVRQLGPGIEFTGTAAGICVDAVSEQALIEGNNVRIDVAYGGGKSEVTALGAGFHQVVNDVILNKLAGFEQGGVAGDDFIWAGGPTLDSSYSVHGNMFEAGGNDFAAMVALPGRISFSDNHCRLTGSVAPQAVAFVYAYSPGAVIASANQLESKQKTLSLMLDTPPKVGGGYALTVVGNVGNGGYELLGSPLPAPWDALNITI